MVYLQDSSIYCPFEKGKKKTFKSHDIFKGLSMAFPVLDPTGLPTKRKSMPLSSIRNLFRVPSC
jgi:hypothetical protein